MEKKRFLKKIIVFLFFIKNIYPSFGDEVIRGLDVFIHLFLILPLTFVGQMLKVDYFSFFKELSFLQFIFDFSVFICLGLFVTNLLNFVFNTHQEYYRELFLIIFKFLGILYLIKNFDKIFIVFTYVFEKVYSLAVNKIFETVKDIDFLTSLVSNEEYGVGIIFIISAYQIFLLILGVIYIRIFFQLVMMKMKITFNMFRFPLMLSLLSNRTTKNYFYKFINENLDIIKKALEILLYITIFLSIDRIILTLTKLLTEIPLFRQMKKNTLMSLSNLIYFGVSIFMLGILILDAIRTKELYIKKYVNIKNDVKNKRKEINNIYEEKKEEEVKRDFYNINNKKFHSDKKKENLFYAFKHLDEYLIDEGNKIKNAKNHTIEYFSNIKYRSSKIKKNISEGISTTKVEKNPLEKKIISLEKLSIPFIKIGSGVQNVTQEVVSQIEVKTREVIEEYKKAEENQKYLDRVKRVVKEKSSMLEVIKTTSNTTKVKLHKKLATSNEKLKGNTKKIKMYIKEIKILEDKINHLNSLRELYSDYKDYNYKETKKIIKEYESFKVLDSFHKNGKSMEALLVQKLENASIEQKNILFNVINSSKLVGNIDIISYLLNSDKITEKELKVLKMRTDKMLMGLTIKKYNKILNANLNIESTEREIFDEIRSSQKLTEAFVINKESEKIIGLINQSFKELSFDEKKEIIKEILSNKTYENLEYSVENCVSINSHINVTEKIQPLEYQEFQSNMNDLIVEMVESEEFKYNDFLNDFENKKDEIEMKIHTKKDNSLDKFQMIKQKKYNYLKNIMENNKIKDLDQLKHINESYSNYQDKKLSLNTELSSMLNKLDQLRKKQEVLNSNKNSYQFQINEISNLFNEVRKNTLFIGKVDLFLESQSKIKFMNNSSLISKRKSLLKESPKRGLIK